MAPQLGTNGVALIGEALGQTEAEEGAPFVGKAGGRLSKLLGWAGQSRADFSIWNAAWCQPPANKLEGEPYEKASIHHCRTAHWDKLVSGHTVLVPLGNVPTATFLGRKGILAMRGYVYQPDGLPYVLPTVHPSFIQRGQSKWSAAFIADIQKAVELAKLAAIPPQFTDYLLDPPPGVALQCAERVARDAVEGRIRYLAFDIETPGKDEEEDELDTGSDLPDATWDIHRVGFSWDGLRAISVPFEPPYYAAIRTLCECACPKVVWNAGFDVPRLIRAGFPISGVIHDGMVAWHILHTDLPKRLSFVATFTCPWQPAWKHLSAARPAYYNATDADVEWRSMVAIESELRRTGLWAVYQRDVLDLQPVLDHMQRVGMLIDEEVRHDRAVRLHQRLAEIRQELELLVPLEARRIAHVYVKTPADIGGLLARPTDRQLPFCGICGAERPRKDHFRALKKKPNPCAGGQVVQLVRQVQEYYRLADFTPSRDQLIRYHQHLRRPLPTVWDRKAGKRKVSFDEEQMKKLMLLYPQDRLYPTILEHRKLDKLASTYIGRPVSGV